MSDWRTWAQFVYLGGGPPRGTDQELQRKVCLENDRMICEAFRAGWQAHAETAQQPVCQMGVDAALIERYPMLGNGLRQADAGGGHEPQTVDAVAKGQSYCKSTPRESVSLSAASSSLSSETLHALVALAERWRTEARGYVLGSDWRDKLEACADDLLAAITVPQQEKAGCSECLPWELCRKCKAVPQQDEQQKTEGSRDGAA